MTGTIDEPDQEIELRAAHRCDCEGGRAPDLEPEADRRKVLIISADIGAGHDLPAAAIAREFQAEDPRALISVVNGLVAMGPFVTMMLRENSAFMFRWIPWWFDLQYRLFMNFGLTRWFSRRLLTLFGARGLLRLVRSHNPDLVVSTYPGVTAVLGELRRQGRLNVPCYSSITDLAGLQFWAHPGIDMHFVTHPESIEEVESIAGPGSVRWTKPPTAPSFMAARTRAQARAALNLPQEGKVIAVSGGGWGVGDVLGAVSVALEIDEAEVLCLCGHNADLRRRVEQRFADEPRLRVMGFTKQMNDVMAASDALIHSSVGMTVLEALVRGCPVISYGFGYGHVRASNKALERFGLARVARSAEELRPALSAALASRPEPNDSFVKRAPMASMILANERRIRPLPSWRVRATRTVTALAASAVVSVWGFTASMAFSLVGAFANTHPLTAVATPTADVGVMVDATSAQVPTLERLLARQGMRVSFALLSGSPQLARSAQAHGDEAVPRLPDSGMIGWIGTDHRLDNLVHALGWRHHFIYASSGPSIAQWLIAHHSGGQLIGGAVRISSARQVPTHLRPGEVIEVRISHMSSAGSQLRALAATLRQDHVRAVPVGTLLRASGLRVSPELPPNTMQVQRQTPRTA